MKMTNSFGISSQTPIQAHESVLFNKYIIKINMYTVKRFTSFDKYGYCCWFKMI